MKLKINRAALDRILPRITLAAMRLLQKTPRWLVSPLGQSLGSVGFAVWKRYRRVAEQNLAAAYPDWSPAQVSRTALSAFRHWGIFLLESLRLPGYHGDEWERKAVIHGLEIADAALARGKGIIIFTGHIGCFELAASASAHLGYKMNVVARYAKSREVTNEINAIRESAGYSVLAYDARGFRAIRKLKNNEVVCMLIDQDAGEHGIFVDYFGRPASTPPGPAVLAGITGAALIGAWVVLGQDGKYHIQLYPETPNPGPKASAAVIQATTQAMTAQLETVVRQNPDQWLWMHRRWKTKPADDE